jgi:hypothetical protein
MDILAAMFAYLVCLAGIVAGLVMSFVVFFSPPGEFSSAPATNAIAMVAGPSRASAAPISSVKAVAKTATKLDGPNKPVAAATAKPAIVSPVAIDAQQKPLFSQTHSRRLAEKARARQLAFREHSSFESRFLHFDD